MRTLFVLIVIAASTAAAFWIATMPAQAPALATYRPDVGNGRTMFLAGGCASCHAVSKEERTRLGGGRPLRAPFGIFFAPNISPHPQDGIGRWSEAQFVAAMQQGTSPDGRHYYPAFPYTSYRRMKLEDVRDLFAYLRTLPPVAGKAREHDLPFPVNIRRVLGLWKLAFLEGEPLAPDPSRPPQWNRGAYLVNGPGHCAECHSARNVWGGIVRARRFAGGPNPEGEGWVPNITQKELDDWSEQDIAYLLETGDTPDGDAVGSSMVQVVRNTSQLSAEDRAAIAAYVKSLPPVEGPPRPAKK